MSEEKELQVTETVEVVKAPVNRATLDVVRDTIFKGATDNELALFCHKCIASGVHPMDGLIHPSKFKNSDGTFRVVFIASIDFFRSVAEDTGNYDGQDEPEYIWENDEDDEHPKECKVKVYRKDVIRPFVGIANWKEFYPAVKSKQFMYDKMPKTMIAKCSEAQGLRKAFPKKLNKLYVEEEMYQATNQGGGSTKPTITQKTEPMPIAAPSRSESCPTKGQEITDEMRSQNKWISAKQVGLIHGKCKASGMNVEKLKLYLKNVKGLESLNHVSWMN